MGTLGRLPLELLGAPTRRFQVSKKALRVRRRPDGMLCQWAVVAARSEIVPKRILKQAWTTQRGWLTPAAQESADLL